MAAPPTHFARNIRDTFDEVDVREQHWLVVLVERPWDEHRVMTEDAHLKPTPCEFYSLSEAAFKKLPNQDAMDDLPIEDTNALADVLRGKSVSVPRWGPRRERLKALFETHVGPVAITERDGPPAVPVDALRKKFEFDWVNWIVMRVTLEAPEARMTALSTDELKAVLTLTANKTLNVHMFTTLPAARDP